MSEKPWPNFRGTLKGHKKIAVFGAGKAGVHNIPILGRHHDIIAILDNDSTKWGTEIKGIKVSQPEAFDFDAVNFVVIASMYATEIRDQLKGLGVLHDQIKIMNKIR
ncbi:MAG: hypothetical protein ACPGN3_05230 [Opitutales bacterium]